MKKIGTYILGAAALALSAVAFTACQDDIDAPRMEVPSAKSTPNTTIAQLKEMYWADQDNYAETIGDKDDPSKRIVIHGRVVSSDEQSNVFKSLVIQDETGALAFSINSYNLYLNYRMGQDIVMDVTGMYIGKYSGLMQMGMPSWYAQGNTNQISFMAPEYFSAHAELNGTPDIADIDTIMVLAFSLIGTNAEAQRKYQSQLVCLQNVHFEEGGKAKFSSYHSSGENRVLVDQKGSTINVRTSGYSTFWNQMLPEGEIDLTGIMSYFGGAWQFIIIDDKGWKPATERPGAKDNPYTVDQAIEAEKLGMADEGWIKGYIVGAVAPGVENVTSDEDIEWLAPTILGNTLVIGQTADTKSLEHALVVYLTSGSAFEQFGNLRDNAANLGKEILVKGVLGKYLGTYGITGNNGTPETFEIDGMTFEPGDIPAGQGTKESPYNILQVRALSPSSSTPVANGVWAKGFIVGSIPDNIGVATLDDIKFGAAGAALTNIVLAPTADCTEPSRCMAVQLMDETVRAALNLAENAGNLGKAVAVKGDVALYCEAPGIRNAIEYSFGGDTPEPPVTGDIFVSLKDTDKALAAGWTFDNVSLGSLDYVWSWKEYNNLGYLGGSAFKDGAIVVAESYAVSPVIDLAGTSKPSASFEHAAKFQTTLKTLCGLYVREQGTTAWTKLAVPTWPEAGTWTYVNSGEISLAAYAGKKIQLAFKYGSNESGADTWQVRNLKVVGEGGSGGDTPVTPPSGDVVVIEASKLASSISAPTTVDGYTFTANKASGSTAPAYHAGTTAIRLYADNTYEIKGGKMTKIVFTIPKSNANRYTTVACSTGKIEPAQAKGDTSLTWVGNADAVTFTVGHDATLGKDGPSKRGQFHFTEVEITPGK